MRILLFMALMLCAAPSVAEDRLQPDFTFKRVQPPKPGFRGPRITVQVEPKNPEVADTAQPAAPQSDDWFWGTVPSTLSADPAQRLQSALLHMQTAPEARSVPTPRLQHLQQIAAQHGSSLLRNSIDTKISPALALAVIYVESAGRADAASHAGAQGLMQLIPATAERFQVTDPLDPAQNIRGGMTYLGWLTKEFGGDTLIALAAYNAGEGSVRAANGIPDFPETRAYVPKVLAAWQVARGLCRTPPQLMSDGCIFVTPE